MGSATISDDSGPATGWTAGSVLVAAVVALQLVLGHGALDGGTATVLEAAAGVYVASMLLLGYVTDRFGSASFLSVLFAGWSLLEMASFVVAPTTGDAAVAVLAAACTAYYAFDLHINQR